MKFHLALITAFLSLAAWASPASAQTIFSMDYSPATAPDGGWHAVETKPNYTRSHVIGAGPSGQNVYEFVQRSPGGDYWGGQFTAGWHGTIESQPPQGSRRVYRWRMWFSPQTNFRGLDWTNGSTRGITNKLLLVGNGCGSRCRFILTYETDRDVRRVRNFRLQLDGGADLADTGSYPLGEWLNIQIELQSSTSADSANGGYKLWINNNDYARPDAQRSGIVLRTTGWGYVILGGFINDGLASDGVHTWRQTDFQVASTFAPNWATGTTQTIVPNPPTNFRVQ